MHLKLLVENFQKKKQEKNLLQISILFEFNECNWISYNLYYNLVDYFFAILPIDVERKKMIKVEGEDPGSPENPKMLKNSFIILQ